MGWEVRSLKGLHDAINASLAHVIATRIKEQASEEPKPPDRPRWRDGTPKKQLSDGRWTTDYAAVLAERHDIERMMADETYARSVYREIGGGDEALGLKRFGEANAESGAREKAEILEQAKTTVVAQSKYEQPGVREQLMREERAAQLRSQVEGLQQQLAALEIDPATPPATE